MIEQRKGRLMLLFLLVVFGLPVAITLTLYLSGWRPGGQSYGELQQPARALSIPSLQTAQGRTFDVASWQGKWHLVMVTPGACEVECRNDLVTMRQIHASLAKEIERLQRVWLIDGEVDAGTIKELQAQYPDLVVLPKAALLGRQFRAPSARMTDKAEFYVVDPLGNFVMRYPPGADPAGIRQDLLKLLKYAWTG